MRRLNIGAGRRHHKNYTTIDIEPSNKADIIGDFRTMQFDNVQEILAEHLLEHFGRDEGEAILDLWNSWLVKGGVLIVETPDFEYICKNFDKDKYWMTRHAYGSQEADWAYHRDGWFETKFRVLLPKHGFEIKEITRNVTRKILPNIRVRAIKI